MTQPVNSPLLKEKYRWQQKEYQLTKHMKTGEYLQFVRERIDIYLQKKGYRKKNIGNNAYTIEKL